MAAPRYVTSTDGFRLALYESGPASAPVLLAVHGYPDDHSVWDGVTAHLAPQLRVVRYDVRGAGLSDAPTATRSYRLDQLVDDVITVLDDVAAEGQVQLLGHDWGSTQLWAALDDPRLRGRIGGFTSISGPSLDHAAAWLRAAARHPLAAAGQSAHSAYTLLFRLPRLPELAIRAGVIDRTGSTDHDDQLHGLALYRANMSAMGRARPVPIDVPVQVLAPTDDPYIRPALALGAPAPWVPDLFAREIPGGHWIVRDRPAVVAECVREFTAHRAGAPASRALGRSRHHADGDFAGHLIVITGAAKGIGRATALEFARHGADVLVADVDGAGAKQTVEEVTSLGGTAAAYDLDVSSADQWAGFVAQVLREHGVPDIVVNNAGIGMAGPVLRTSVDDWERVLGVNLWGVIHGARLFGDLMVERGLGGHVVNIASAAAFAPSRTLPAYATTKAAVLMLSDCLRAELAGDGIAVTAVCPGFVDSDITRTATFVGLAEQDQRDQRERAAAAYHRRNYPPEKVARRIVRAVRRGTPVATVTPEAKVLRAISRFAPPLARRIARIDLGDARR
jgi:NAD(P)-dependent dehydrogenase (short-subunit alcohol dehydrogenase family)/pimeloyl-ACP methyl ester carboxylesterase